MMARSLLGPLSLEKTIAEIGKLLLLCRMAWSRVIRNVFGVASGPNEFYAKGAVREVPYIASAGDNESLAAVPVSLNYQVGGLRYDVPAHKEKSLTLRSAKGSGVSLATVMPNG